ncbi:MAG: hypothetical protein LBE16_04360 [Clostridiales Family XIII bacterium]|nr:hypothetical protein [Clostridiales Family XIII bacterium]
MFGETISNYYAVRKDGSVWELSAWDDAFTPRYVMGDVRVLAGIFAITADGSLWNLDGSWQWKKDGTLDTSAYAKYKENMRAGIQTDPVKVLDDVADLSMAAYFEEGESYYTCIVTQKDGTVRSFAVAMDAGKSVFVYDGDGEYVYDETPSGGGSGGGGSGAIGWWGNVYGPLTEGVGKFTALKDEATERERAEGIVAHNIYGCVLYADGRLVTIHREFDAEKSAWIDRPYTVAENAVHMNGYRLYIDSDGVLWSYQKESDEIVKHKILDNIALPGEKISGQVATPDPLPGPLAARPTASTVLVDGESVAFDAYNIDGNNHFKLRDLAFTLSGTEKQFEVGWDGATGAIALTSGKAYTPAGGEMEGKGAGDKTATPTTSKITLDGKEVSLTAYNIGGNNYFKLRDIGAAFDFGVEWDGAKNSIVIDTGKGYTPE